MAIKKENKVEVKKLEPKVESTNVIKHKLSGVIAVPDQEIKEVQ